MSKFFSKCSECRFYLGDDPNFTDSPFRICHANFIPDNDDLICGWFEKRKIED